MSIYTRTKINHLLTETDTTGLYFSEWLRVKGYSDQLLKRYRDSGWFTALSQGVMYRTGSQLSANAALASCCLQTGAKHRVAAHSALEYAGYNHYVPMGKPVLAVALSGTRKRPQWMQDDKFDMSFRTFNTDTFTDIEVVENRTAHGLLYVSSPEMAILECLYLAPKFYDYTDLYYVMEQLTTLRSDVVQRLLESAKNFRVKRMFLYMAEKAGHDWMDDLNTERINLGTSKMLLVSQGVYIPKYRITVPKELNNYEV